MLQRQLSECREALKFANQTCEQFEQRVEELETDLHDVRSQCVGKESTVSRKSRLIEHLETRLDAIEQENLRLREEIGCLNEQQKERDSTATYSRSRSYSATSPSRKGMASQSELQSLAEELTTKLHNSNYQRGKLQEGMEKLLSENHKLNESLVSVEGEVGELQFKIKALENTLIERDAALLPTTPTRRSMASTPTHLARMGHIPTTPTHSTFSLQSLSESLSEESLPAGPNHHNLNGVSLFSEFKSSHAQLQNMFDKLVSECKCPASASYRLGTESAWHGDVAGTMEGNSFERSTRNSLETTKEESLTDLFQEVFVTLKQTTLVADKLLERRYLKPLSTKQ